MLTFTFSILKRFGVRIVSKSIRETYVFTLITGKISDANLISTSMNEFSANFGKPKRMLRHIKMVANWSTDVKCLMAGKKSNTIQILTKPRSVEFSKMVFARKPTVLTIIQNKKDDIRYRLQHINYIQEIEGQFKISVFNTKEVIFNNFSVTWTEVKLPNETQVKILNTPINPFMGAHLKVSR